MVICSIMAGVSPSRQPDADRVRAAHADVWAAHGRFREPAGGGDLRLPGIRVMASGLPHPQWNNGDIDDPAAVDLDTVVSRGASTTASPSWTGCRSVRASA
jgi:tRNA-dihydrouridine synthase